MSIGVKTNTRLTVDVSNPLKPRVWLIKRGLSGEEIALYTVVVPFLLLIPTLGVGLLIDGFYFEEINPGFSIVMGWFMASVGFFLLILIGSTLLKTKYDAQYIEMDTQAGIAYLPAKSPGWHVHLPLAWIKTTTAEKRIAKYGKAATDCWHLVLQCIDGSAFVLHAKLSQQEAEPLAGTFAALLANAPRTVAPPVPVACGVEMQTTHDSKTHFTWTPISGIWRWVLLGFTGMLGVMAGLGIHTATEDWHYAAWGGLLGIGVWLSALLIIKQMQRKHIRQQLLLSPQGAVFGIIPRPGAAAVDVQTIAARDCSRITLLPQRDQQYDAGGVLMGTPESIEPTVQANFLNSNVLQGWHKHKLKNQPGIVGLDFNEQPTLRALQIWVAARQAAEHKGWPIAEK